MDNSNMATLSMEPRKWIITLHNNYWLTSYSISCRHIAWHQECCNCWQTKCCTCYYHPKMIKTSFSMWSPLIINASTGTQYLLLSLYYPWLEWFGCLCFLYCAWAGFIGGEAWEDKLHACCIQHVMWYLCTLLACYSQISYKISWVTLLAHAWKCQVKIELYYNCNKIWDPL